MKILDRLRKAMSKPKLMQWHEDHSVPDKGLVRQYANGRDRIYTKELSEALDRMYVKRHFEYTSLYVDVYWYVKPSRDERHVYTVYYRTSWGKLWKTVNAVERHELPRTVYYAFQKIKKEK